MVVIAAPANPLRCPPAPYERASLIAHYLKTKKPRSKVLILDAKDGFSSSGCSRAAWKELYPGMIERVALSRAARVTSVDPATNTLVTDFGNDTAQVANVIPPQKAGRIAEIAGAADQTGWCPIDPATFESTLVPNIHVIGDACIGGAHAEVGSAANAQAKACAAAIVSLLSGEAPGDAPADEPATTLVAPGYGVLASPASISRRTGSSPTSGRRRRSPVDAPREMRAREADSREMVRDHHG